MNQIKEDSQASQSLVAKPGEEKKIKHVLNCLTPTQRKFAMPAAQDKIVYLYFICSVSNQLPTPLLPRNVPSTVNIPQAQILAEVFP